MLPSNVKPNLVKNDFSEIGKQYIKLRTNTENPFEVNFFEKLLPLQKITNSQDIAVYWYDKKSNALTSFQKSTDHKEKCVIPIDCKGGPLPGVVAYFKYEYMISDAEEYAKWYCNYIQLPERVKSILSFPILCQKSNDLIAVVELYRHCCYPYTEMDLQYVRELSKWIALSLEQNLNMEIEKNINDIDIILSDMLLDYFGGYINYITYMTTFMDYVKNTVNAHQLFFYFVSSYDKFCIGENCSIYTEEYNKKTKKTSLVKLNTKIRFFNKNTFEYKILREKTIINERITLDNDPRIDSQIRPYIIKKIISIVYIPVLLNKVIVGIIVLINKNVRTCNENYINVELDLLMKMSSYLSLAIHYVKVKRELDLSENKYTVLKESLVHILLKKVDALDDIDTNPVVSSNFYGFDWAPQDTDNIISLTYFMFTNTCKGLFIEDKLKIFLSAVKKSYHDLPYHNFKIGFLFVHVMFCILHKIDDIFDIHEKASLLLICLMRYADYNGLHNKTMELLNHPMTRLYDKSYHQKHSVDFFIFLIERTKFLSHLNKNDIDKIFKLLKDDRITVSDTKDSNKNKLIKLLDSNTFDFNHLQTHQYLRILLIWCTYHARHSLKLELSKKINEELYREWFSQGDLIATYNKQIPQKHFDRLSFDNLNEMELKHINNVLLPHFELLCRIFPTLCEFKELLLFTKKAIELQIDLKYKKTWSIEQSLGHFNDGDF